MQITQYETKKKNPAIVTVVQFDPWPFRDRMVHLKTSVAIISGGTLSRTTIGYVMGDDDNCLVTFEDGTMAVANLKAIEAYNKKNFGI